MLARLAAGAGLAALVVGMLASGAVSATEAGHTLTGAKLTLHLANPATGYTATTSDRMDKIAWIDSSGKRRTNFVANGGPLCNGDPQEFFGQSYGEPEGTGPLTVIAGSTSTWTQPSSLTGTSATGRPFCGGKADARVTTVYTVFSTSSKRNEVQIKRTFKFGAGTPVFTGHGERAYVPRLPVSAYPMVLWPNAAGTALESADSRGCPGDCEVTDWNGRWFADDNGSGSGMAVIRASASIAPALLTVNSDGFSASNLSDIVLIQPSGGWKSAVTETEILCFYDPTSWPASKRTALELPAGCAFS